MIQLAQQPLHWHSQTILDVAQPLEEKQCFVSLLFFFQQENESWCLSWANSWSPNGQALDNPLQWLGGREADRKAGSLCHEWCAGSGTHLPEASRGQRQREAEPRAFEQCPYCWCNLWEVNFWLGSLSNWAMTAKHGFCWGGFITAIFWKRSLQSWHW